MATNTRPPGVGVLAALEGAGLIAWHLVATPFVGRKRLHWGTRGTEATDPLPGDELVPNPKWSYTLGIDVAAPPEAVWPWIAQIGQRRGGFYSYQTLENLLALQDPQHHRAPPRASASQGRAKGLTCIRRHRLCGSKSSTRRTRWFSSAPRQMSPPSKAGGFRPGSSSSGPDQPARVDSSPVAAVIFRRGGQPASLSDASPSNPSHS